MLAGSKAVEQALRHTECKKERLKQDQEVQSGLTSTARCRSKCPRSLSSSKRDKQAVPCISGCVMV